MAMLSMGSRDKDDTTKSFDYSGKYAQIIMILEWQGVQNGHEKGVKTNPRIY